MIKQNVYNSNDYMDSSDNGKVLEEIRYLAMQMGVSDFPVIERIYEDITLIFSGKYNGFRANSTKYHNLEHTNAVALAMTRLIHGLWVDRHAFAPDDIVIGIIAALFHDTGLIQTEEDTEGTGAKYTIGHEQRSIALIRRYLPSKGFSGEAVEDCANMVLYTILFKPIDEIPFRRGPVRLMGQILGSSDLLAQMADRSYLEKLPLLFLEFQEGGLKNYKTELDLIVATENFYEAVFKKRLLGDMGGIARAMQSHFRERWNIDRDLYSESLEKNIDYLRSLNQSCKGYDCYLHRLRRGNIIKDLYGDLA